MILNDSDPEVQTHAYAALQLLSDKVNHDELVEHMMDQLICISWDYHNDENKCLKIAKDSSVYVEFFGKGSYIKL